MTTLIDQTQFITLPSLTLTPRQLCDLELLLNQGFKPLSGFLSQADYQSVLDTMRLQNGALWPMPITLDVSAKFLEQLGEKRQVALRDVEGRILAVLTIQDIWRPDKQLEAQAVFGTTDQEHPAVRYLMQQAQEYYIGGEITFVDMPKHYDHESLRHTPEQLKAYFHEHGWDKVVAFQTRNPMHRAHYELTLRAAREAEAKLLIHPVVGMTKPGDVDHYTRVRCYKHIMVKYPDNFATISLLPLAMRMGGPREALWHALVRKNYGCTHFIVGRDHAGPGNDSQGKPFYGPYDAQELVAQHEQEIGVTMVPFQEMVYLKNLNAYRPVDKVTAEDDVLRISGTQLRKALKDGADIPDWFTYKEVVQELRRTHPPKEKQGVTLFFTGLSGAGKSTLANILLIKLMELGGRTVTLLDGDEVRNHLSSELTFSKEHRDLNIRRIGYVASEITKHGGIAICAPIAPYRAVRREVRDMVTSAGQFIEIYISTPLSVCEQRDTKGLYAKARSGQIANFTGISDPYEEPEHAEITLDTSKGDADAMANQIFDYLCAEGYIQIQAKQPVKEYSD